MDCIDVLLVAGADINHQDNDGKTALCYAAELTPLEEQDVQDMARVIVASNIPKVIEKRNFMETMLKFLLENNASIESIYFVGTAPYTPVPYTPMSVGREKHLVRELFLKNTTQITGDIPQSSLRGQYNRDVHDTTVKKALDKVEAATSESDKAVASKEVTSIKVQYYRTAGKRDDLIDEIVKENYFSGMSVANPITNQSLLKSGLGLGGKINGTFFREPGDYYCSGEVEEVSRNYKGEPGCWSVNEDGEDKSHTVQLCLGNQEGLMFLHLLYPVRSMSGSRETTKIIGLKGKRVDTGYGNHVNFSSHDFCIVGKRHGGSVMSCGDVIASAYAKSLERTMRAERNQGSWCWDLQPSE